MRDLQLWKQDESSFPPQLLETLELLRKPSKFLGLEPLRYLKPWEDSELRMVLIYPDDYEVAISHYGSRVVCKIVNSLEWASCDLAFVPPPDAQDVFRRRGLPIYSLGYKKPISQFDVIAFSMPVHSLITNVLSALSLSGIPLSWSERGEGDPLVIMGGSASLNPLPLMRFFDVIYVGEAEVSLRDLLRLILESRGKRRRDQLESLLQVEQVLIPPLLSEVPHKAKRGWRVLAEPPEEFIPLTQPVHDRLIVEVARGCERGCRFCLAGIYYRPRRDYSLKAVADRILKGLKETGYSDVSLLSLSVGDWKPLIELVKLLMPKFWEWGVHLSLPSLYSSKVLEELLLVWSEHSSSSITIAPEAGTERLRRVVNKKLSDDEILSVASMAFDNGWSSIKMYFILGLPTETEEDLRGIADLVERVVQLGLERKVKRLKVTASLSVFTPQPFTPFQWAQAPHPQELSEKIRFLRRLFRRGKLRRYASLKVDDPWSAAIESALERGDEALSEVVLRAWQEGASFDLWEDWFNLKAWLRAFNSTGLSLRWYLRARSTEETLPWERVVDPLISREWLMREWELSLKGVETPLTGPFRCSRCGVCDVNALRELVRLYRSQMEPAQPPEIRADEPEYKRYRFTYEKVGLARYLSGKEVYRLLIMAFQRASRMLGFSLARSGMKRRVKLDAGVSIPVGYELTRGYFDLWMEPISSSEELLSLVNEFLPSGLRVLSLREVEPLQPSVTEMIRSYSFTLERGEERVVVERKSWWRPDKEDNRITNIKVEVHLVDEAKELNHRRNKYYPEEITNQ